jgi:hypothetical protein
MISDSSSKCCAVVVRFAKLLELGSDRLDPLHALLGGCGGLGADLRQAQIDELLLGVGEAVRPGEILHVAFDHAAVELVALLGRGVP